MSNYNDRLKKLKQNWDTDKAAQSGSKLPEGKYQWTISRAFLGLSKAPFNKGNVQFTLELAVAVGALKGRKVLKSYDLESKGDKARNIATGISYFKQLLETLQLDFPKSLEERELKKLAEEMINMVVYGVCVINKKGYPNYYINGIVNAAEQEDSSDDDDAEAESESDTESSDTEDEDSADTAEADEGSEEDSSDDTDGDSDTEEAKEEAEEEEEEEAPPPKKVTKPAPQEKKQTTKATTAPAKKAAKESPKSTEEDDDWDAEFNK